MDTEIKDYRIVSKKKYYWYFFIVTIISVIGLSIIQINKPSLFFAISFFFLIEFYLLFRKQIVSLGICDDQISLEYFQFLKKFAVDSPLKNVKIDKKIEMSNVNGMKKFTLKIIIKGKRFSVNILDGFDEEDLVAFYDFFLKGKKNG